MDFELVAIALDDVAWIMIAFAFGFVARSIGLPPLVGFLAAGFLLNPYGLANSDVLEKLADLGITLLLFTVGLKLNIKTLAKPQVWAVTGIHMLSAAAIFTLSIYGLALIGASYFSDLRLESIVLIAFALSFSSTVFVVKVLEEKGGMTSLHGRIAVGILIMQDIIAVLFLAFSTGKLPSIWALPLLLLLIPLRPLLNNLLQRVGHGELLVLYGFLLALGGAEIFEMVGMKGDLGALVFGVLVANHAKSEEMAKTMLGFKDLFLLGFFVSIGFSGVLTTEIVIIALIITPFVFLKSVLFFALLTRFKLRSRTSLLATINLSNYSEFGLIVAAIGVSSGWLDNQWLIIISIALALSFTIAAGLSGSSHWIYSHYRQYWHRFQRSERLEDDHVLDIQDSKIAIIGMGGVGTSVYDTMRQIHGETVIGLDIDPVTVHNQQETGRNVLVGDPSDADFWDRVSAAHTLELVLLIVPKVNIALAVLDKLRETGFDGQVAAAAKFQDEIDMLKAAGADIVFNMYTEAGSGFAAHVSEELATINNGPEP